DVELRVLDVLQPGSFKGTATVAEAHIAGRYEAALAVAETLVVGSAAHISGSVQCGKLLLEDGGQIDGHLRLLSNAAEKAAKPEVDNVLNKTVVGTPAGTEVDVRQGAVECGDVPPAPRPIDALLATAAAAADDALLAKAEGSFRGALKANVFDVAALS